MAYDFELTNQILSSVFDFFTKPLGVKLPPYVDFAHFDAMASILNKYPIAYVNCTNSVVNGLYIVVEKESVVIKPKGGFGGIGSEYIKPTALANVRAFYNRLNEGIRIIGTGGIKTGQDAFEHLLCGATKLQIGIELQDQGTGIFKKINAELLQILEKRGYQSIENFRGKLRSIS